MAKDDLQGPEDQGDEGQAGGIEPGRGRNPYEVRRDEAKGQRGGVQHERPGRETKAEHTSTDMDPKLANERGREQHGRVFANEIDRERRDVENVQQRAHGGRTADANLVERSQEEQRQQDEIQREMRRGGIDARDAQRRAEQGGLGAAAASELRDTARDLRYERGGTGPGARNPSGRDGRDGRGGPDQFGGRGRDGRDPSGRDTYRSVDRLDSTTRDSRGKSAENRDRFGYGHREDAAADRDRALDMQAEMQREQEGLHPDMDKVGSMEAEIGDLENRAVVSEQDADRNYAWARDVEYDHTLGGPDRSNQQREVDAPEQDGREGRHLPSRESAANYANKQVHEALGQDAPQPVEGPRGGGDRGGREHSQSPGQRAATAGIAPARNATARGPKSSPAARRGRSGRSPRSFNQRRRQDLHRRRTPGMSR